MLGDCDRTKCVDAISTFFFNSPIGDSSSWIIIIIIIIIIGVPSAENPAGPRIVSLGCDAVGVDSL